MSLDKLKVSLQKREKTTDASYISLPSDFACDIPQEPLAWLRKYNITDADIHQHHIGWSDNESSLIYAIYDDGGHLSMVQSRLFEKGVKSRFYTKGRPEAVFYFAGNRHSLYMVVVEDYISAIRVGGMPLWGSNISIDRIRVLGDRFKKLVIWLDKDKAGYALRAKIRAEPFFDEVKCVITERDPKDYSDAEIRTFVEG